MDKSDPSGLKPPEVVDDNALRKAAVEAQVKILRTIPKFAEQFKKIDANDIHNVIKNAQDSGNNALKTPNALKANRTVNGSWVDVLRQIFSPSSWTHRTVTSYHDPQNRQTQTGRDREPIFGLASEIGEMFHANGAVQSKSNQVDYDNVSIEFENAARAALGANAIPINKDSILH